jgi:hypothetical protein
MADEPIEPPSTGVVDESTLVPVERDRRFVVRLVLLLLVGAIGATFFGAWVQRRAGACGHSLLRPGESVIPPPR